MLVKGSNVAREGAFRDGSSAGEKLVRQVAGPPLGDDWGVLPDPSSMLHSMSPQVKAQL